MLRVTRCLYSTSTSTSSATSIAHQFLTKHQSSPPRVHTQLLDANQLQRLSATISRPELSNSLPKAGTQIPASWHLAYFTPCQVEEELGQDGSDTTFNPPSPFTRRMWAGGELDWVGGETNRLRVGQEVGEKTSLVSAVGKRTKAGEEMVVVGVEKSYETEKGVALIDKRNWIFRPEITKVLAHAPKPSLVPFQTAKYTRDFIQTPITLFRFSALTFNGHKIHYNKDWCQTVEGHRDLVVHGPLNLINMVNLWRDVKGSDAQPKKITYRATSPLYAGEKYRVMMDEEVGKMSQVKIVDIYGVTSMIGMIEAT